MELIDVVARGLARLAVASDPVPHLILHDQHPELPELLAQLLDVVADDAVVYIHVALVVEYVQTACDVYLQRRRQKLRLLLVLRTEAVVEVLQNGHILRARVGEVVPVDEPDTAVYDGLFHGLEALLRPDDDVAEGEDEVHLERQGVVVIGVVQVQVHRVHILLRGRRDLDDLPVQALDEGPILRLGVADDDVVICEQIDAEHLTFGGEALARAGRAEDDAIRVLEQLAVNGDHVPAERVHAAVERAGPALE